ncbi:MAG: hypothetical protein HDT44_07200 [Ruminococcaceae bacterium]|nr:hypothetical protein [Oscillospiraceae bacterium]
MIYIKRTTAKGKTKPVEITDGTKFYTHCASCGKEVDATDEVINDFGGFLNEENRLYCEDCSAAHSSKNAY